MFINKSTPHRISGFTMIEVLITILVVSIGLLGLAGLQISGLRANMGSEARSKATILANDIAERMHANPLGVDASNYGNIDTNNVSALGCNTAPTPFCSSNGGGVTLVTGTNGCTTSQMATFDAWVWTCGMPVATGVQRGGVINQLLNGSATVTCDIPCGLGSIHTISVNWSVLNPNNSNDGNNTETLNRTYTLVMVP
jgi:type IV pilus assembly protein PilV